MEILMRISGDLQNGLDSGVEELTKEALEQGMPAIRVMNEGLVAGMNIVGAKFRDHEIFLPDVLLAARAMNRGMDVLKPLLINEGMPTKGRVVIGSVKDDLHDIGKNLVGILLRGAGFEVIDLGNDVPAEAFIEAANEQDARVIGMSALLTTTMPVMKKVVEMVREKGMQGKVRILVGGAPVSEEFAMEIGADAYAFDGANAVETVERLCSAED